MASQDLTLRISLDTRAYESGMGRLHHVTHQTMERIKLRFTGTTAAVERLQRVSWRLGIIAASMGVALGYATKVVADYHHQIAAVGAVTAATAKQLRALSEAARRVARETPLLAKEAAETLYLLGQAGFKVVEIVEMLDRVAMLALATGANLKQAGQFMASSVHLFGAALGDNQVLIDTYAQAVSSAALNLGDLQQAMKYVGPIASSLRVDMRDLTAAIALMADHGIRGSKAGAALNMYFQKLLNPTRAAIEVLEQNAISIRDLTKAMMGGGGLIEVLKILEEAQLDAGEAGVIFGVRQGAKLITLIQKGTKALEKYRMKFLLTGTATEIATRRMNTLRGEFIRFRNELEEIVIDIGTRLEPALITVTKQFKGFVAAGNRLPDIVKNVGALTLVFMAALAAMGLFISISGHFTASILLSVNVLRQVMTTVRDYGSGILGLSKNVVTLGITESTTSGEIAAFNTQLQASEAAILTKSAAMKELLTTIIALRTAIGNLTAEEILHIATLQKSVSITKMVAGINMLYPGIRGVEKVTPKQILAARITETRTAIRYPGGPAPITNLFHAYKRQVEIDRLKHGITGISGEKQIPYFVRLQQRPVIREFGRQIRKATAAKKYLPEELFKLTSFEKAERLAMQEYIYGIGAADKYERLAPKMEKALAAPFPKAVRKRGFARAAGKKIAGIPPAFIKAYDWTKAAPGAAYAGIIGPAALIAAKKALLPLAKLSAAMGLLSKEAILANTAFSEGAIGLGAWSRALKGGWISIGVMIAALAALVLGLGNAIMNYIKFKREVKKLGEDMEKTVTAFDAYVKLLEQSGEGVNYLKLAILRGEYFAAVTAKDTAALDKFYEQFPRLRYMIDLVSEKEEKLIDTIVKDLRETENLTKVKAKLIDILEDEEERFLQTEAAIKKVVGQKTALGTAAYRVASFIKQMIVLSERYNAIVEEGGPKEKEKLEELNKGYTLARNKMKDFFETYKFGADKTSQALKKLIGAKILKASAWRFGAVVFRPMVDTLKEGSRHINELNEMFELFNKSLLKSDTTDLEKINKLFGEIRKTHPFLIDYQKSEEEQLKDMKETMSEMLILRKLEAKLRGRETEETLRANIEYLDGIRKAFDLESSVIRKTIIFRKEELPAIHKVLDSRIKLSKEELEHYEKLAPILQHNLRTQISNLTELMSKTRTRFTDQEMLIKDVFDLELSFYDKIIDKEKELADIRKSDAEVYINYLKRSNLLQADSIDELNVLMVMQKTYATSFKEQLDYQIQIDEIIRKQLTKFEEAKFIAPGAAEAYVPYNVTTGVMGTQGVIGPKLFREIAAAFYDVSERELFGKMGTTTGMGSAGTAMTELGLIVPRAAKDLSGGFATIGSGMNTFDSNILKTSQSLDYLSDSAVNLAGVFGGKSVGKSGIYVPYKVDKTTLNNTKAIQESTKQMKELIVDTSSLDDSVKKTNKRVMPTIHKKFTIRRERRETVGFETEGEFPRFGLEKRSFDKLSPADKVKWEQELKSKQSFKSTQKEIDKTYDDRLKRIGKTIAGKRISLSAALELLPYILYPTAQISADIQHMLKPREPVTVGELLERKISEEEIKKPEIEAIKQSKMIVRKMERIAGGYAVEELGIGRGARAGISDPEKFFARDQSFIKGILREEAQWEWWQTVGKTYYQRYGLQWPDWAAKREGKFVQAPGAIAGAMGIGAMPAEELIAKGVEAMQYGEQNFVFPYSTNDFHLATVNVMNDMNIILPDSAGNRMASTLNDVISKGSPKIVRTNTNELYAEEISLYDEFGGEYD